MFDGDSPYRMVPVETIMVPDLRVTSVMDPDMMTELGESIAAQGILQPLQVEEIDGQLWLVDGLHRLRVAKQLAMAEVPCIVSKGTTEGNLLKNLVVNRQRGKSNPAQEAALIRQLMEGGDMPLERIARITGLSVGWTRRLYDISHLPASVLALVADGKLGISHAIELLALRDETLQREVAQQAVEWRYTVEQVKIRVATLLQPAIELPPGSTQFDTRGAPSRIPILCYYCRGDLGDAPTYVFACGDCQQLTQALFGAYQVAELQSQALRETPPEPTPPSAPPVPDPRP